MKAKRILCGLLASLLLAGSLASCGNSTEGTDTAQETVTFAEEVGTGDDLPADLDFKNETVTFISRDKEGWTRGEISVEGLKGDPVNDVVFERNKAVESRLNVTINSILDNTDDNYAVVTKVNQAIQAGSTDYDVMAACAYTAFPHTVTGNYADLADTFYIDLTKPWWAQGYNDAVSYNGMQYSATGSILLSTYRFAFVTVFNKDLFNNANQPYLYEYVESGEWTLDKQISLIPLLHQDDGDPRSSRNDVFGFVTSKQIGVDPYWSSCEVDIVKKNADGELEFVLDRERLHTLTEKLLQLYYGTNGGTRSYSGGSGDPEQREIRTNFVDGKAAMATLRIMELENQSMRNMENAYGVVPMPKFNREQEDYHTFLHDQFTIIAVPTTVTEERLDMVSAVLEAMGSISYQTVRPVYYEDTLRTKLASDPDTSLMLEIIVDGIYIDLAILDISFGVHHGLREMVAKNNNNTASRFQSMHSSVNNQIQNLVKSLDRLADAKEE